MIPTWGQPRLCGEHDRGGVVAHELYGATPLIRGTPSRCCFLACVLLLNPDYAGRAWPTLTEYVGLGATPQMRGTLVSALANPRLYGSPPHMRGTPARRSSSALVRRINPDYAGNTNSAHRHLHHSSQPRLCGEHFQACGYPYAMRSIPEYAGNTTLSSCSG